MFAKLFKSPREKKGEEEEGEAGEEREEEEEASKIIIIKDLSPFEKHKSCENIILAINHWTRDNTRRLRSFTSLSSLPFSSHLLKYPLFLPVSRLAVEEKTK